MTSNHLLYIPLVLIAGFLLGFWSGRRAALAELADAQRRLERRRARRNANASPPQSAPGGDEAERAQGP